MAACWALSGLMRNRPIPWVLQVLLALQLSRCNAATGFVDIAATMPVQYHDEISGHAMLAVDDLKSQYMPFQSADQVPVPIPTIEGIPPVSTTMKCIISMTSLFFVVYTALFCVQAANEFGNLVTGSTQEDDNFDKGHLVAKYLASGAETLFFTPMLCILFLATRMRAVQLAQGDTERFGLPQWWAKHAMIWSFWFLLFQSVLTLVSSIIYGDSAPNMLRQGEGSTASRVLSACRYGTIFGIYACFTIVCVAVCTMSPPVEIWGPAGGPKVSPAVFCTVFLSVQYFAVYIALAAARTASWSGMFGEMMRFGYGQDALLKATGTVSFAPMLCVLFVAARLRALQLDPQIGHALPWTETCFYLCAFSVTILTLLVLLQALVTPGKDPPSRSTTGKSQDSLPGPGSGPQEDSTGDIMRAMELARWVVMASLYISLVAVIVSLPLHTLPDGTLSTPDLPGSLRCVMVLVAVYFSAYLVMWLVRSYSKFGHISRQADSGLILHYLSEVKEPVDFSPMLCILFLGTLLRAMQLTGGRGAPADWVQDAMWLAVWAVVLQLVSTCLARLDKIVPGMNSSTLTAVFDLLRYVCLLVMYVSVALVVFGLFTMTPATANGRGALSPRMASWVIHI